MHRIVVEEKRWIGDARSHALNYCMLLPDPEAQQLATYLGWLMHRTLGGLIAGVLFVLPGAIAIMALSWVWRAVWRRRLDQRAVLWHEGGSPRDRLECVAAHQQKSAGHSSHVCGCRGGVYLSFVGLPFPLIVAAAGIGYLGGRLGWRAFKGAARHGDDTNASLGDADSVLGEKLPAHTRVSPGRSVRTALVWLALWLVPVGALLWALGPEHTFSRIATFFSTLAVVTFGGAYAVLAYVAQQAEGLPVAGAR